MKRRGQPINSLRALLGNKGKRLNQTSLGELLGVSQKRVSAWESGGELPPCRSLIEMGNLAAKRGAYDLALQFWEQAGLALHAMAPAAGAVFREELKAPKGKIVVAVLPLSDEWFPVPSGETWYVDSRLVPNPTAVRYWEGRGSDGRKERREVIIVDTSLTELSALWGKFVLI